MNLFALLYLMFYCILPLFHVVSQFRFRGLGVLLDLSFSDLCLLFYLKMKHKNQMGSTKKNHHGAAHKLPSAKG